MGRKRKDNPKVPLTLSVLRTTKQRIREGKIDIAEELDRRFNPKQ